ncbi:molybdopterin synthase sulfur carrier subunit [Halobacteriales archaeon SW_7_71_33]|nr:MAG: molybdopterin synthase sulfur carrier subunit [Halobacteriales archaeon SW_7_71_33]
MTVEWRLFADLAERAGQRRVSVRVEPTATVGDALAALFEACPALRERGLDDDSSAVRDSVTVLCDGDPAATDDPVDDADELALLPPASGG